MTPEAFSAHQKRVKGVSVLAALDHTKEVAEKKAKFGNTKVEIDGELFDSKREAARYEELKLMEKGGLIRDLRVKTTYRLIERQDPYDDQPALPATTYTPDFDYEELFRGQWRRVTEDVKFAKTANEGARRKLLNTAAYQIFRIKIKLMRQVHGLIVKEV